MDRASAATLPPFDAIVVGSGMAGLTSAASLSAAGLRTLVLEQAKVVGGCTQVFRRAGRWEFDVGVHYIGECGSGGRMERALHALGLDERVELRELDPDGYTTIVLPQLTFRVPRGWDRYLQRLVETFPDEERGLRRCIGVLRYVAERVPAGQLATGLRDIPALLRTVPAVGLGMLTLEQLFDLCHICPLARVVLAGESGDYAAPPSQVPVVVHAGVMHHYLRGGAYYPRGGGQVLAANLVDVITAHGGVVRTAARVARVLVEDGAAAGVRMADGEEIRARVVVSNADYRRTMLDLVGREHLRPRTVRSVEQSRMALPLFSVYLGLDVDLREHLANSSYWIYPDAEIEASYAAAGAGQLSERPPVFLTSATTKDPGNPRASPPGHSTLELMGIAPADRAFWAVDGDPAEDGPGHPLEPAYLARKDELAERLIAIASTVVPDLRRHIVWREAATPITHERYTLATGGACYGLASTRDQIGPRRPGVRTEIDGLYLTGSSTVWGHGVVGTTLGGIGTAGTVLGRDLVGEVLAGGRLVDPARLPPPAPDPLVACRLTGAPKAPAGIRPRRPPG